MKNFKSHFRFNKQERSGIFFLLLIIVFLQGVFFYVKLKPFKFEASRIIVDEAEQSRIDSLKQVSRLKDTFKIYPFNPNFITDYKGYTLGMSVEEIDRLITFRSLNKYIDSKEEFQQVTKVNDSLLNKIAPYFKFPDWVKADKKQASQNTSTNIKTETAVVVGDLNQVTATDLRTINGIGTKLSARIIKFRDRLGGFLVGDQLYDVYGLDVEVANRALKKFQVLHPPRIEKININSATVKEIASLVYISYPLAEKIVDLRDVSGGINSFDELTNLDGFPSEKLERIALYLSL
ncbi:ComEA family DNA-binding protein [Croceitalea marina]|uniref:ComEA family DNA-binding protein n=1 Tax=Croceitalea marina TaxID=1775166 RepID=A0ABW5MTG1_9FLAO